MATFWLEYEQNGNLQKFPFDAQSISIGRDKSSDFVLDHPTVSRQHAIITHDGRGSFRLVALSRGGLTAIERVPVQGDTELYDGAVLHIGQLWFRFRSDYAAKRPASQSPNPGGYGDMGGSPGQGAGGFGNMGGSPGQGAGGFGNMGSSPGQGAGGFGNMGGSPGQGAGSFGNMGGSPSQGAGGFGNMGGSPSQGAGSFGNMGGSPGQGAGSFGNMGDSGGGFGSMPGGSPKEGGPAPRTNDAGIVSWDEIAQSKEATQDEDYVGPATDYERINAAGTEPEKTNPLLVVVGLVLVVGMVGWMIFGGEEDSGAKGQTEFSMNELPVVDVKVSCIGEVDCMRQARATYARGIDLIEKQDVENRNLFDGYLRMLETRALLAEAGVEGIPEEMRSLEPTENAARQALDRKFREFKVQFHQSKQKKDSEEMVRVVSSVKVFFPEMTAREYRWAANMETEMKRNGTYPRSQ